MKRSIQRVPATISIPVSEVRAWPLRTGAWLGLWLFGRALAAFAASAGETGGRSELPPALLVGVSTVVIAGVNESEAKAAMKAWGRTVFRDNGLTSDCQAEIVDFKALVRGFQERRIDIATMSTAEYLMLRKRVAATNLFVPTFGADPGEEYVVVARIEDGAGTLADLRDKRVEWYDHPTTSLAVPWLEIELRRAGLPRGDVHFSQFNRRAKVAATVLPVFFGSSSAALVTRRGFVTMVELNPQVGARLRVIASSPRLIPSLFCFNGLYDSPEKSRLLASMRDLHLSTTGKQILTTFQVGRMVEYVGLDFPVERQLLEDYARLAPNGTAPAESGAGPGAPRALR